MSVRRRLSGPRAATVAGLVAGALGIGILWASGVEFPFYPPPGMIILVAGALFVGLAPMAVGAGRWSADRAVPRRRVPGEWRAAQSGRPGWRGGGRRHLGPDGGRGRRPDRRGAGHTGRRPALGPGSAVSARGGRAQDSWGMVCRSVLVNAS